MNDSLQARHLALAVIERVLRADTQVDSALDTALAASALDTRDKAFATALAMGTLRRVRLIDALLKQYLQSSLSDKGADYVMDVLRMGVAQLLFLDVPAHAAVHSSVEMVKQSKFKGFAKLANGVLQSVGRTGKEKLAEMDVARTTTPEWLWKRWVRDWDEPTTRRIAEWNLKEPQLDITVKSDPAGWAEKLGGIVLPNGSVRIEEAGIISQLEGFKEGEWWVQDAAASIPARLLGDLTGKKVLDLCAAPGGKTAQLVVAGGDVKAVDKSPARLRRVGDNLKRLNLKAHIESADMMEWQPKDRYDAILLDAPCSATGTIRRHPDVVSRKDEKDIRELAELQRNMLLRALGWLKPGGTLVYCTCSLETDEGEAHIQPVLNMHRDVSLVPVTLEEAGNIEGIVSPDGYIRTHPYDMEEFGGMDGFFAAKFQKK